MKKKMAIIMLGITMLLVGCSGDVDAPAGPGKEVNHDRVPVSTVGYEGVKMVKVSEVVEKIKSEDQYTFVLGNENCAGCITYKEYLKELENIEGVKLDYIDIQVEKSADVQNLLVDVLGVDVSQGFVTPTTYFVKDGKLVDYIVGVLSPEDLIAQQREFIEHEKGEELVTPVGTVGSETKGK